MVFDKSALPAAALAIILFSAPAALAQSGTGLDNATCLSCHGSPGFAAPAVAGQSQPLSLSSDEFAHSVHGVLQCTACHATITAVPHTNPLPTAERLRQQVPAMCGACHAAALNDYRNSVHGRATAVGGNVGAPVCTDCHTAHAVADPQSATARIAITRQCGTCHADALASYQETHHGKLFALGYADTATCSDCHRGHDILAAGNPASSVSAGNVLNTCRNCHQDAAKGFATFEAHATSDNFSRYPASWLAAKGAWAMIFGVFGICWLHSAAWFYREIRDRQQRRPRPHVRSEVLSEIKVPYVRRWSAAWRFAHLVFALSVIVLAVTGLPLLFPHASWAPTLERLMGGPDIAGLVHRIAGVVMTGGFVVHFGYVGFYLARNFRRIGWFGPYSLLPTLQDGRDLIGMVKWFFGAGPRPQGDHWNYQQKLDYWGSFSGVALLTISGAMLWFKTLNATYLPGWSFDVATVVHGHEAIFAAGYLFTVHYFVNHWRPDKFPIDIVMFTGSMPLEEFKREYGVEYARLSETGELQNYLIEAPSPPMALGSKILGLGLIVVSVALLVMMVNGIVGSS